MKVAVTGASGHIGSAVCRELLKRGYEVAALVRKDTRAVDGLPVSLIHGSILEESDLKDLFRGCDGVIHVAGIIKLGYRYDPLVYDINVTGAQCVFDAAFESGVKRIVHISSIHVYNQQPYDEPLDESRRFVGDRPIFYDQTKKAAHQLALKLAGEGRDIVIVAPTSALGPPDFRPSKIGKAIIDIYKGSVPAAIKGGFDFTDVRDVASGIVAAFEKGRSGESYLVGGKYYTIKELADTVLEAKGSRKRLTELPRFMAYAGLPFVKSYAALAGKSPLYDKVYLDILRDGNKHILSDKAYDELGYQVRPLKETVTDLLQWFKDNGRI